MLLVLQGFNFVLKMFDCSHSASEILSVTARCFTLKVMSAGAAAGLVGPGGR